MSDKSVSTSKIILDGFLGYRVLNESRIHDLNGFSKFANVALDSKGIAGGLDELASIAGDHCDGYTAVESHWRQSNYSIDTIRSESDFITGRAYDLCVIILVTGDTNLADRVISGGNGEGTVEHTVPYAHYMYEGIAYGPNVPITQGGAVVGYFSPVAPKHPTGGMLHYSGMGSRHWDEAAKPTQLPMLVRSLQAFVDSGALGFGK